MKGGLSFAAAAALVLLTGALWGAVNGFVVARWKLQPFIATLATMSARAASRATSAAAWRSRSGSVRRAPGVGARDRRHAAARSSPRRR
jgi:ribose/xylose/arabinose/galactoside ABC-type transport system permease subunit